MPTTRAKLFATACLLLVPGVAGAQDAAAPGAPAPVQRPVVRTPAVRANIQSPRTEGTIASIKVEGNARIEQSTIRSYMLVSPGDPFDPDRIDRSLKTLFATGLFQDVSITCGGTAAKLARARWSRTRSSTASPSRATAS